MSTIAAAGQVAETEFPALALPRLAPPLSEAWSLQDLQDHLGGISLDRIRLHPGPGTATLDDALALLESTAKVRCELIDGVLVEKVVGYYQSLAAAELIVMIGIYLRQLDLGKVIGEFGPFQVLPNQMRMPDVAFFSWRHLPGRVLPRVKTLPFAPDLVVEILSDSNTAAEMERKLVDCFTGGTKLFWVVEPELRTVDVFTSPTEHVLLHEEDTVTGGDVLPGFEFVIRDWFDRVGPYGSPS